MKDLITFDDVINELKIRNYKIYSDDSKNYNLNIVGIRKKLHTNSFDDVLCVFWRWKGLWNVRWYTITTDPGLKPLKAPKNPKGVAILKPNQYIDTYEIGLHKGVYKALVQRKNVTVYRDKNLDSKHDLSNEDTGLFGINIHRANDDWRSIIVDSWSEGCQVLNDPIEYSEFIGLCEQKVKNWGKSITYTLLSTDEWKA